MREVKTPHLTEVAENVYDKCNKYGPCMTNLISVNQCCESGGHPLKEGERKRGNGGGGHRETERCESCGRPFC
jgi:hypothetical protein